MLDYVCGPNVIIRVQCNPKVGKGDRMAKQRLE